MELDDRQTITNSATFDGLEVTMDTTLPECTDDTLPVSVDITTNGTGSGINVAIVVDTSGSTRSSSGSDVDGDPTNGNETYLEAEQFAAKALFEQLQAAGYDPAQVTVSLIEYNGGSDLVGTYTLDQEGAFDAAVDGLTSGGSTNFEAGLDEVLETWGNTTTDADPDNDVTADDNNLVIFLSDGRVTSGDSGADEVAELETLYNAQVTAIGVGGNSDINDLNTIDNTGGAQQVTDAADLAAVIGSAPPLPELEYVEVLVNGVVVETFNVGDPELIETPLGYRIDETDITGWPYDPGTDITVEVRAVFDNGASVLNTGGVTIPVKVCFVRGTRIMTRDGLVAVEDLVEGMELVTQDGGLQPVVWVGMSRQSAQAQARDVSLRPICIRQGAMGRGLPQRDLLVSRQHSVQWSDSAAELLFDSARVLVTAGSLLNDHSITIAPVDGDVDYFHVALSDHHIIFAEGLPVESFRPTPEILAQMAPSHRAQLARVFPMNAPDAADAQPMAPVVPFLRTFETRALLALSQG